MIIVFHDRKKVTKIFDFEKNQEVEAFGKTIQETIYLIALTTDNFVGWCHLDLEELVNHEMMKTIFNHDLVMASFSTSKKYIIPEVIGYVENSTPFLKIKYNVSYPTWLMSSDIGAINAQVIIQFKKLVSKKMTFDLYLNYISKEGILKGLFCYSDPRLLRENSKTVLTEYKKINVFNFVKNHYRGRWLLLLLTDIFLYEKKFKLWQYLKSIFTSKLSIDEIDFSDIEVKSIREKGNIDKSYDVLIPTLGRATYLEDVLKDLAKQTILPAKVILVEQNAIPDAKTELDYVYEKKWPFEIDHVLIHQLGACNARNIALSKVTAPWVFFADDDIRLTIDLVEKAYNFINQYGVKAITMASLMKNEVLNNTIPMQWHTFSTNSSFVNSSALKEITFGMEHEFGFGEDSDFGMKIRNKGADIIFYPNKDILHLKAPTGGFRAKTVLPWDNDEILPKPSPTVMAHKLKHITKEQLLGYRTILFFKFFKAQSNKNPFSYYSQMSKKWDRSKYWATELIKKHNPNGV